MINRRKFLLGGVAAAAAAPLSHALDSLVQVEREWWCTDGNGVIYWWADDNIYYKPMVLYDGNNDIGGQVEANPQTCDLGPALRRLFDDSRREIPVRKGWVLQGRRVFQADQPGDGAGLEGDPAGRGEAIPVPQLRGPKEVTVPEKAHKSDFEQIRDDTEAESLLGVTRD